MGDGSAIESHVATDGQIELDEQDDAIVNDANVPPVVSHFYAYNHNYDSEFEEGDGVNFFGEFIDPSSESAEYTATVYTDGLDGEGVEVDIYTYERNGQTKISVHSNSQFFVADDGSHEWILELTDGEGGVVYQEISFDVAAVAPTVSVSSETVEVDEGTEFTINFSAIDPGDDTISLWEVNWGDDDGWQPYPGLSLIHI